MDRRSFLLKTVVPGALCAGLVSTLAGCGGLNYVAAERRGDRLAVRKADLGPEPYAFLRNPQRDRPIFLHHDGGDDFTALLAECTHRSCSVDATGDRLTCPCHGSEFSFAGDVLEGPAELPLYRYDVATDAEHVYVVLPDPSVF